MSLLEQVKPAGAPGVKEVQVVKQREDNKIITNNQIKDTTIFDGYLSGIGDPSKVDKVQDARQTAQTQYTLADMKLFYHQDDDNAFKSIMASGMLMA